MARQSGPPRYSAQSYDRNAYGVYDHGRCEWLKGHFHTGRLRRSKAKADADAMNQTAAAKTGRR